MDTQRLILFLIFAFSALFLWEAWQKENAPAPPPQSVKSATKSAELPPPSAQPIAVDRARDRLGADHVADPPRRPLRRCCDQLKKAPIDSTARAKNRFECAGAAKAIQAAAANACRR